MFVPFLMRLSYLLFLREREKDRETLEEKNGERERGGKGKRDKETKMLKREIERQ